jgi:hypothetical protein
LEGRNADLLRLVDVLVAVVLMGLVLDSEEKADASHNTAKQTTICAHLEPSADVLRRDLIPFSVFVSSPESGALIVGVGFS